MHYFVAAKTLDHLNASLSLVDKTAAFPYEMMRKRFQENDDVTSETEVITFEQAGNNPYR